MKALLLKDTLGQKPNLVLGALYSLIFFVAFAFVSDEPSPSFVYVVTGVAVGMTILLGSFGLDKNDTMRFMMSLPITRAGAVNAKFLLLALGTAYGTLCAVIIGAVGTIPAFGYSPGIISGLDLLRITSGMLILSFFIPLYFRLGQAVVRYILIIGMGLLVIGQIVGMLVLTFRGQSGGTIALFDMIFTWLRSGEKVPRNLVIGAIGAGVAGVSYLASRLIWRRRDI
jgi:hypothetical protein